MGTDSSFEAFKGHVKKFDYVQFSADKNTKVYKLGIKIKQ